MSNYVYEVRAYKEERGPLGLQWPVYYVVGRYKTLRGAALAMAKKNGRGMVRLDREPLSEEEKDKIYLLTKIIYG